MLKMTDITREVINNHEKVPGVFGNREQRDPTCVELEVALQRCGVGRYNYILFFICTLSLLTAAAEIFGVGLIISSSQCDLQLDVWKKGIIGSVPMLGIIVSAHAWGFLADTYGRRFAVIVSLGGTCICAVASGFSHHWIMLAATKFLSAIFASGTSAVTFALLGECQPLSHRSRFMLFSSCGLMFSQGFIAATAYPIVFLNIDIPMPIIGFHYRPWRLLAQIYGLMNGLAMLLMVFCIWESPKFYISRGEEEKGIEVLRNIFTTNTGKDIDEYNVKTVLQEEEVRDKTKKSFLASMWNQTVPLFYKQHIKNTLLLSYLSIVTYSVGPPVVIWLPTVFNAYLKSVSSATEKNFCEMLQIAKSETSVTENITMLIDVCDDSLNHITLIGMISLGSHLCILGVVAVFLAARVGKRWCVIGVHVLSGVCAIVLNHVYSVASAVVFVLIVSNAICMGMGTAFAVELFPTYMRATAVSLTIMVGRGVSFIVINVLGPQLETNCINFFYVYAAFILSGAILGWFLPKEKS